MISEKMKGYVNNNSAIRAMFEEGKRLASIYGRENVYDFSLGNPSIPAPKEVKEAIVSIINEEDNNMVHGYMSNAGFEDSRALISDSINRRFGTHFTTNNIIMTVGAAGGFNSVMRALLNPGDQALTFAPYFVEYRAYVTNFGGELIEVSPNPPTFQPNLVEFEAKINEKTKVVIVNSPNNPTGIVYSEKTIIKLCAIMDKKQKEYGHEIYLLSDEPYRELAYDGAVVPYLTKYYNNTIVAYSFSKSLSLPGERIGYLVIPNEMDDYEQVYSGVSIATRILGYVNAPSLMQRVAARCIDAKVEVEKYDENRELLYNGLVEYGFECAKPEGAFYLWVKSPMEDEREFVEACKSKNILVVQGRSFACPGYVRMAYCVSPDTIKNALPKFKELADELFNK